MPKLIYIKASAAPRRPAAHELIDRIRSDDTAAYLPFETAAELEEQVVGDLATLLAERFDESRTTEDADVVSGVDAVREGAHPGPLHRDDRTRGRHRPAARSARPR